MQAFNTESMAHWHSWNKQQVSPRALQAASGLAESGGYGAETVVALAMTR